MKKRDKLFLILIIVVPQLAVFWKNMEWQYSLILLLVTLAIVFIIKWEQLGEVSFTKDGFGFKLKENIDELKTDMNLITEMNKPLFIGHIETQSKMGEFDLKKIEMLLAYFSNFYSEDNEIKDLLTSYKNRLIRSLYWWFARESDFKENQTTDEIKKKATALTQEWIIKNPEDRSPHAVSMPGEAHIRTKEEVFSLRDKMIAISEIFDEYGI